MPLLVSIVMPAYNAEETISESIRSAIAQAWDQKEIIVVDDGSSDNTLSIARRFESKCLKVVVQENQGVAAARNTALSLCQGDYIQYLDADDLLAPDKISSQMAVLGPSASRRTLLSSSWGTFFYRYYRAKFTPTALWCDLSPLEWLMRKFEHNVYFQTSAWLVSRELTAAAGPWNARLRVDNDGEYFARVVLASDCVQFVPAAKVYYRNSGPGSVGYVGNSDVKRDSLWLSIQLHIRYIRSLEDSERVRAACVQYLQRYLSIFFPERPDIVKQAEELTRQLGGQLGPPTLYWTLPMIGQTEVPYSWIKSLFGFRLAKRARLALPLRIWSAVRMWDKMLFRIQSRPRNAFWNGVAEIPSASHCAHKNATLANHS